MLEIFNSEFATVTVNLIVIVGVLLFVYFVLRKFLPTITGEKLKDQIRTSTTSQNVFAFVSVVIASTFLDLFTDKNFHMLWTVLVISILTILFNFLYEKVSNKNDELDTKEKYSNGMALLSQIIDCKGYGLIKNANELESIEQTADEIYVFSENLITDIKKDMIDDEYENKGLFFEIVNQNIPKGKKYIYFLKDTKVNRKYYGLYTKCHFDVQNQAFKENISFYFIPEEEFCFYSEIYLYKDTINNDQAFEWIPSIGEEGREDKQFYLQLSSSQVQNLNEIICELMISHKKYSVSGV